MLRWFAVLIAPLCAYSQFTPLSFRPVQAQYSNSLDRIVFLTTSPNSLHIYDPASSGDRSVALPKAGVSLAISTNGTHAAVLHDSSISFVDLNGGSIEKSFGLPVGTAVSGLLLSDTHIHLLPGAISVRITDGALGGGSQLGTANLKSAALHPNGSKIYVETSKLGTLDVSTGPIAGSVLLPQRASKTGCGDIWFSQDGTRIFCSAGFVSRASADAALDWTYLSTLPLQGTVKSLADSTALNIIATIMGSADDTVRIFGSEYLRQTGALPLPGFVSAGITYGVHGRWVFFNSSGTVLNVVMQADASARLTNDFAIQRFVLAGQPPCSATFSASTAKAPADGAVQTALVYASPDCIYTASSDVEWMQPLRSAYRSNTGLVEYAVRPNRTGLTRSGLLRVGAQAMTVTQDPVPVVSTAPMILDGTLLAGRYNRLKGKLVYVATDPDELHVLDVGTGVENSIALPVAPVGLALRPDGGFAAVSHDGWVSYVNLDQLYRDRTVPLTSDAAFVALGSDNSVYVTSNQFPYSLITIDAATGRLKYLDQNTSIVGPMRIAPDGSSLYSSGQAYLGTLRWTLNAGTPSIADQGSSCGSLWLTETADRVALTCGYVLAANSLSQYLAGFSPATQFSWMDHSASTQAFVALDADPSKIRFYAEDYTLSASVPVPAIGTSSVAGAYVFWNSAGDQAIVLEQALPSVSSRNWAVSVIRQSTAADGCTFTLSSNSATLSNAGGQDSVAVNTGPDCRWLAHNDASWLVLKSAGFRTGPGSITFSAGANPSPSARTAHITMAGKTLTVSQAPGADVTLSPASASVPAGASFNWITLTTSNPNFDFTATSNSDWALIVDGKSGKGSSYISYWIAPNNSVYPRTATFTIAGKAFQVTQSGMTPTLALNPASYYDSGGGQTTYVAIVTNPADYISQVKHKINVPWIKEHVNIESVASYLGLEIAPNQTGARRTGSVTIGNLDFVVTQDSIVAYTNFSPQTLTFDAGNGYQKLSIDTNLTLSVSNGGADWIRMETTTNAFDVSFYISPNYGPARTATVYINSKPLVITQAAGTPPGLHFVSIPPCRQIDTRLTGEIVSPATPRSYSVQVAPCKIPADALALFVNVTAVPNGPLAYLKAYGGTNAAEPAVSTLNAPDGLARANSAIVSMANSPTLNLRSSSATHVIVDISGYFTTGSGMLYYPITPCRMLDTRDRDGQPIQGGNTIYAYVPASCSVPYGYPNTALAANVTVVPAGPLNYLTVYGNGNRPVTSTLNSPGGKIVANAALIPSLTPNFYASDPTHVIADVFGYFLDGSYSLPSSGLVFHPIAPCRMTDTRFSRSLVGGQTTDFNPTQSNCGIPSTAKAYALNATVVPSGPLAFLTLWPSGKPLPNASTLNAFDGLVTANATIVGAGTNGAISALATSPTDLILDITGYFDAPI